tara:strand:- start:64 stop:264 length:201 start_codon:yes stop_codon:yes gene_type:complete
MEHTLIFPWDVLDISLTIKKECCILGAAYLASYSALINPKARMLHPDTYDLNHEPWLYTNIGETYE